MSKRERWLLAAVVIGAAVFVADRLVVAPVTASFAGLDDRADALEAELAEARALVDNAGRIERRHRGYLAAGLNADPSAARARVQQQLNAWSRDAGLALKTQSAGRVVEEDGLAAITITVSGEGELAAVRRFLWEVSRAASPLRVVDCELTNRNEKEGRVGLALTLSTVVMTGGGDRPQVVRAGDAEPWRPLPADPGRYDPITGVDIFDPDGPDPARGVTRPRPAETRPADTQPATQPAPADDPDAMRVLVGVTIRGQTATAFIEDRAAGELNRLSLPADYAAGRITDATVDGVTYAVGDERRRVGVGQALTGRPPSTGGTTATVTGPTDEAARPAAPANESEILRRLRERRQRQ